jgi:hypothetical protein
MATRLLKQGNISHKHTRLQEQLLLSINPRKNNGNNSNSNYTKATHAAALS